MLIPLNEVFFYFIARKIKYFLDPPKKAQGYKRSRYGYTHKCLSIPGARDLDIY